MNKPDSKIAVTLFNLREHCKTPEDLDRTLEKLCRIGYRVVQVSGVPLDAAVIGKALEKHGLFCCATHENLETISRPEELAEKLDTLRCDFAALGAPPPEYRTGEGFEKLKAILEKSGEVLAGHGLKLGYHNHHFEFIRDDGGKTYLSRLYDETSPEKLYAELDVHWIARGGQDPVKWICRCAGRMPVIHFKDFAVVSENGEYRPAFCEVGEGNLDWPEILRACEEAGVRFYSVEQDMPFGTRDIFESMKISFDNLTGMGVK